MLQVIYVLDDISEVFSYQTYKTLSTSFPAYADMFVTKWPSRDFGGTNESVVLGIFRIW